MGSYILDDYTTLELYLKQAEEEIGQSLSSTSTPQTPVLCERVFPSRPEHERYHSDLNLDVSDDDPTPVNSPGFCDKTEPKIYLQSKTCARDKNFEVLKSDGSVIDDSTLESDEYHGSEDDNEDDLDLSFLSNKIGAYNTSFHGSLQEHQVNGRNSTDDVFPEVSDQCNTPECFPSVDISEDLIYNTLREHRTLRRSNTAPVSLDDSRYENNSSSELTIEDPVNQDQCLLQHINVDQYSAIEHREPSQRRTKRSLSASTVQTPYLAGKITLRGTKVASPDDVTKTKEVSSVTRSTNTTDSLERPKKRNRSSGDVEVKAAIQKPTSFPQKLAVHQNMRSFIDDQSPEMQMLVNSTSPVLMRRKPTNRRNRPRIQENIYTTSDKPQVWDDLNGLQSMQQELKKEEEDYNKKDMSKTWDGFTINKWNKIYAPMMRSMLTEMNNNNGKCSNGNASENLEVGSKTMPSKTLLDEMHKKYCAYQYKNRKNLDPNENNMTLPAKFKSSPPPPDRMKSRSWLLQHYTIPHSINSGSSSSPDSPEELPQLRHIAESANSPEIVVNDASMELKRTKNIPVSTNATSASASSKAAMPSASKERETTPTATVESISDIKSGKGEEEIEAVEACRWLKEAGFPQYAQMYDDLQFPVDISVAEKEHDFLDKDSLQPLVRRLSTLNKCAVMKIGTPAKKTGDDSDDEDQCALSDKWKYQHNIRRWSRKDLNSPLSDGQPDSPVVKSSSSNDSLLTDQNSSSEAGDSPVLDSKMHHEKNQVSDDYFGIKSSTPIDSETATRALSPRLRRAASERIKGAKNFLKRMESFKSRKTRRIHRNGGGNVEISGPVIMDKANMQEKIRHLNCKELSPSSETAPSPIVGDANTNVVSADISVKSSDSSVEYNAVDTVPEPWSDETTNYKPLSKVTSASESALLKEISETSSAYLTANEKSRDSTLPHSNSRKHLDSRLNQSDIDISSVYVLPNDYKPGSFPRVLKSGYIETENGHGINYRTGSFNLGSEKPDINANITPVKRRGSAGPRVSADRASIYDNVEAEEDLETTQQELDMILQKLFQDINGLNKAIYGEDAEVLSPPSSIHTSTTTVKSPNCSIQLDTEADDSLTGPDDHDVTSGTASSTDCSDHDIAVEDLSHDDSSEHIECRDRRDSGVGSSLTRGPSEKRRYRIRWHSFQKSHRPSFGSRNHQISNLSVCQIMVLQKLCLCRLTGLIEKYSPNRSGWTWSVPRFMKRHKAPDYSDRNVFSVPLLVTLQRTGQPLPQCMLHAMRYLRKTSKEAVGIFRKSGVRSRIQKLKNEVEANPEMVNFEDLQAYDVADLLKQYFRELPECLLTNKLSEIYINIFIYLPAELRVEALQTATVLLPDENREVLQSLLLFLADIAQDASEHQMTASNLAVCFAPSLFNMSGTKSATQSPSPRRPRKNLAGVPDARELQEQKAAHECLTTMILECKKLFIIPTGMMSKCRFSYIEQGDPVCLEDFNSRTDNEDAAGHQTYVDNAIQALLKESRDKFKGWVSVSMPTEVDVSYKKVGDGHPLRLWKCSVEVEAPPEVVLDRVKDEQHIWDEDLVRWSSLEKLDQHIEVFQYSRNSMAPHPCRDFCVLRSWKTDLPKGACALISTSVEHPKVDLNGAIQGVVLVSHFLIEPCGSGKSRITHMSRVDMRGRTPEWYKKAYSHICVHLIERIRDSFRQRTEGPESTV